MTHGPDDSASDREDSPRDAALAWFVRLESGDADAGQRADFARWLAHDPVNRREYERLAGVWRDLDRVPDPRPARRRPAVSRRGVLAGAAAAAAAMAVTPVIGTGTIRTGTGERRSLTLDDGSLVDLDAGSGIAPAFTPAGRRVRLVDGRARFTPAAGRDRPFTVTCGDHSVTTRAAVFTVHGHTEGVVVAVEHGTVEVACRGIHQAHLGAGACRIHGTDGPGTPVPDGVAIESAWRQGRLVFRDQPLAAVVADLNRYHPARIVLWGAALAGLRVDGTVDITRPDTALNAIARTLPVRMQQPVPGVILLRAV